MSYKWRQYNVGGALPKRAVRGGTDACGSDIFVGRAMHSGFMLPAKVIPANNSAYVSYDGQEVPVHSLEVLTGKEKYFAWVPASSGTIAPGAVAVGEYETGEQLFIGRVPHEGSLTVGKVHPTHGCIYIGFGGAEISYGDYEVLTSSRKEKRFFSATEPDSSDSD